MEMEKISNAGSNSSIALPGVMEERRLIEIDHTGFFSQLRGIKNELMPDNRIVISP